MYKFVLTTLLLVGSLATDCPSMHATFEEDASGNGVLAGHLITDQFSEWGLTISAQKRARNGDLSETAAMIFDSSNPTGGDYDLGSPNELCPDGGPGKGIGGEPGQPGENCDALGNLLIISEDEDASDPDDNLHGGIITFSWDRLVTLNQLRVIDNDEKEYSSVECLDIDGQVLEHVDLTILGTNNVQTVTFSQCVDVVKVVLNLASSGGVADIEWEQECDCGDCHGGIDYLALQYNGAQAGEIRVEQRQWRRHYRNRGGLVVFEKWVNPGEILAFNGQGWHGKLGRKIKIYVDGELVQKIDTTCATTVRPGMTFGDFGVIDGSSRRGGNLCPLSVQSTPMECSCKGGVKYLRLKNNGDGTHVRVVQKDGRCIFSDYVGAGEEFDLSGQSHRGTFGYGIKIYADGCTSIYIDTTCNQEIGIGSIFDDFQVVDGSSKCGGELCEINN